MRRPARRSVAMLLLLCSLAACSPAGAPGPPPGPTPAPAASPTDPPPSPALMPPGPPAPGPPPPPGPTPVPPPFGVLAPVPPPPPMPQPAPITPTLPRTASLPPPDWPGARQVATGHWDLLHVQGDLFLSNWSRGLRIARDDGQITVEETTRVPAGQLTFPPDAARGLPGWIHDATVAPDGRHAVAWAENVPWVIDLFTRERRRLTTDPPPAPRNLPKHAGWAWATQPRWSADGQWIYFMSNRLNGFTFSLWRVPAAGGQAELLSAANHPLQYLAYRGRYGPVVVPLTEPLRALLPASLLDTPRPGGLLDMTQMYPVSFTVSPDQRLAAFVQPAGTESASFTVQVVDWATPQRTVLQAAFPGTAGLARGPAPWSPDGRRLLLNITTAGAGLHTYMAVLDITSGRLTEYSLPDLYSRLEGVGWVTPQQVLVRQRALHPAVPANDDLDPWWIVDLNQAPAVSLGVPRQVMRTYLTGRNDGRSLPATGGERHLAGDGGVELWFDRPVDPAWLAANIRVDGIGATLSTVGGRLGQAYIRIAAGAAGEDVRIAIPALDYRLTVHRSTAPQVTALEIRQQEGPWQPLDAGRTYAPVPTEVRLRFDRPLQRRPGAVGEPFLRWNGLSGLPLAEDLQGETLTARTPAPPPLLWPALTSALQDETGLPLERVSLPPLYFGAAPTLVRLGADGTDATLLELPQEVISVEAGATRAMVQRHVWMPPPSAGRQPATTEFDLATGQRQDGPPLPPVSQRADARPFLRLLSRRQDLTAGLELVGATFMDSHFIYAADLVVLDAAGAVRHRIPGLRSYWPFTSFTADGSLTWSPDGRYLAAGLATAPGTHDLYIADLNTGTLRHLPLGAAGNSVGWSPSGRQVTLGSRVLDFTSGQEIGSLGDVTQPGHLRWNATETRILYNVAEWGAVRAVHLAGGAVTELGVGLAAGWAGDAPLLVRWPDSRHRWRPPSM